jgi:hypothetical protein
MPSLTDLGQVYQNPQPDRTALQSLGAMLPFGTGSPAEMSQQPSGLAALASGAYNYLGNLAKRAIGSAQMMQQTGVYDPAPIMESALLPMGTGAIAGVPVRGAETVLGAGPIRAYHGSPHDFDKFDLSKIGSGEGAQAYGHGLYFAEHEPVAQQYRDQLKWKGADFNDHQVIAQNAIDRLGDRAAAADSLESAMNSTTAFYRGKVPPAQAESNKAVAKAVDLLRSKDPITGTSSNPGRMYEVNINADPAHFLDWDKPLTQQHSNIQGAANRELATGDAMDLRNYIRSGGDRELANAGIPGIKYLDQGSRAAGDGSRNYVVFNDRLIDILRKYGFAGAVPAGALAYGQQDQQQ